MLGMFSPPFHLHAGRYPLEAVACNVVQVRNNGSHCGDQLAAMAVISAGWCHFVQVVYQQAYSRNWLK